MTDRLESDYDCSRASADLQQLQLELGRLQPSGAETVDSLDRSDERNRLENQIHFIRNKCRIH